MEKRVIIALLVFNIVGISAQSPNITDFGDKTKERFASTGGGGLIYNAEILFDNVDVRNMPSLKASVVNQVHKGTKVNVIGISREKVFIDNYNGHWFNISLNAKQSYGWVYGKYVKIRNVFTTEIRIKNLKTYKSGGTYLNATYEIGNRLIDLEIKASKGKNQEFFTFTWDFNHKDFHYSNIPGCYIWYPNTGELEHITYLGGEGSFRGFSLWAHITDDRKFLIQDFGTCPPPRFIVVWRIKDGEIVFDGSYLSYNSINLQNNTIEKVNSYRLYYNNRWNKENTQLSDEQLKFARAFFETHPPDQEALKKTQSGGNATSIMLISELKLDSQEETILRGEYMEVM